MKKKVTYYFGANKYYISLHHQKGNDMNFNNVHILLSGIIILLAQVRGSRSYI